MEKIVISVRGLFTRFENNWVHQDLSLRVRRSEIFVILGESGSGKSVLLKVLFGFIRPVRGDVFVDGYDVLQRAECLQMRRKIAFLFQGGALFDSLTVGENIALRHEYLQVSSQAVRDQLVERNLALVALPAHFKTKMPEDLSLGEKRQVALARSLSVSPNIQFYDEPTTGLDLQLRRQINHLILQLRQDLHVTSVVVTHDIYSAFAIADRIAVLSNGRIVACGTVDEIASSQNAYVQRFIRQYAQGNAL